MSVLSKVVGFLVKIIFGAIIGALVNWIRERKAAYEKARADALATREESNKRAQEAQNGINAAAEAEKARPYAETDEDKVDEVERFFRDC